MGLVLASFVAYALQEGSARLSIRGRTTLGGAMRKFMRKQICTSVAMGILVGNTAYQANNLWGRRSFMRIRRTSLETIQVSGLSSIYVFDDGDPRDVIPR